jgi:hypothetical protein
MADSAGTLIARGKSGRQYLVDLFQPDAVNTEIKFSPSGKALTGSPATIRFPEDVTIQDISIVTGATATGGIVKTNGAVINGGALRWSIHLNTLANRPLLNILIPAGADMSILQN